MRTLRPHRIGLAATVAAIALAMAQLGGNCVDGVTPDCSDAAACGPVVFDASVVTGDAEAGLDAGSSEAGDAQDGG
jgi:hypothetical protein